MSIIKRGIHLYCISNIVVSFVCVGLLGTTYCDNQIIGQQKDLEASAQENIPLSQLGDKGKASVDVIEVPEVNELKETAMNKVTTTKKTTTTVVSKKEVKSTTKYTPAKYNAITGNAIVDYAKKYLGLRYVSNGFSLSTGTDCSGFTKLIYREFGINLSRSAKGQSSSGSYVRKSDLQKGDLVFYGKGSNSISHVAIYIGDGQVIHESNHRDGVKISSVNMMRYITARRVINSKANAIAEEKLNSKKIAISEDTESKKEIENSIITNNDISNENATDKINEDNYKVENNDVVENKVNITTPKEDGNETVTTEEVKTPETIKENIVEENQ